MTDVEQTDTRLGHVVDSLGQYRTHYRKLEQVVSRAVDIGTEVEHMRVTMDRRDGGADRWTIDAGYGLEHELGHTDQRAGITGTDHGLRLAFVQQVDRNPHGRVFFLANSQPRIVVHFHHLGGMVNAQTIIQRDIQLRSSGLQPFAVSGKDQRQVVVLFEYLLCRRQGDFRAEVSPHCIDGNSNLLRQCCLLRVCRMQSLPSALFEVVAFIYYFTALVIAVGGNMMTQVGFTSG